MARPAEASKADIAQIILRTAVSLDPPRGRLALARILRGSRSKNTPRDAEGFGALLWCPQEIIESYIEQLVKQELLKRIYVDNFRPILVLSDAGKKVLEDNISIPLLEVRHKAQKPFVLTDSLKETLEQYKECGSVSRVAETRKLAESTIWSHLAELISGGLLFAEDVVEEERAERIADIVRKLSSQTESAPRLREIKLSLPPDFSYEEIRCVLAAKKL